MTKFPNFAKLTNFFWMVTVARRAQGRYSPTPTGLESFSPGLAQQRLPWVSYDTTNPERVEANIPYAFVETASTPTGLERFLGLPGVAARDVPPPQPWAICLQPFQGCSAVGVKP